MNEVDRNDVKLNKIPSTRKLRRYTPQIIAVIIKNSVLFVYGLSIGLPTILIPNLSGSDPNESIVLDEEGISWIASVINLTVPFGCVLSGLIAQKLGRKLSLLLVCVPFLTAFLLIHWSSKAWYLFLALALIGTAGGLSESPALSYAAEVAEPKLRGSLSCTSTLFICIGILVSFIAGTFWDWRRIALILALAPLASFFILLLIPETPYWLLTKNKVDQAEKSLAWFRGCYGSITPEDVKAEFLEIQAHLAEELNIKRNLNARGTWKPFIEARFMRPYLLILLIFVICHFGITPITAYAVTIFTTLQVPIGAYYATIITGTVNLLGTITCSIALQHLGKRKQSFICLSMIFTSFLLLGIYSFMNKMYYFESTDTTDSLRSNWIPLVCVVTAGFFNYLLINSLPWILMGEIYYNDIRDVGTGISAATGYIVGFVANKTFLNLVNFLTLPGVFWLYSGVAICGLVLLYFLLPETEGKPLHDIAQHYNGGIKLDNNVKKANR